MSTTEEYSKHKNMPFLVLSRDLYISQNAMENLPKEDRQEALERIIALHGAKKYDDLSSLVENLPVSVGSSDARGLALFSTEDGAHIIATRAAMQMCGIWRDLDEGGGCIPTMLGFSHTIFLLYYCEELTKFEKLPSREAMLRGKKAFQRGDMTEHSVWTVRDREILDSITSYDGPRRLQHVAKLRKAADFVNCAHVVECVAAYIAELLLNPQKVSSSQEELLNFYGMRAVLNPVAPPARPPAAKEDGGEEEGGEAEEEGGRAGGEAEEGRGRAGGEDEEEGGRAGGGGRGMSSRD